MPALAYYVLQTVIVRMRADAGTVLAQVIGRDVNGKASPLLYICGAVLAWADIRIADTLYVLVALTWLIPDRRIERAAGQS